METERPNPGPTPERVPPPEAAPGSEPPRVVGRPVEVTPELVERFARATGAPTGPGAGELPATLAAALTADVQREVMAHPDLAIDLSHTLHTAQASEHHRPLRIGDTLTATATVTTVRPTRGGRTVGFRTVLADAGGTPVQTLTTTLLTAAVDETPAAEAPAPEQAR